MTKTVTPPRFLRAAGGRVSVEDVGPWVAQARQADELRKRIKREGDPVRRARLVQEHTAALAKQARIFPLGPPTGDEPLTFEQRLAMRRRAEETPGLVDALVETIEDILYTPDVPNRAELLSRSFAEFTAAVAGVDGLLGGSSAAKTSRGAMRKGDAATSSALPVRTYAEDLTLLDGKLERLRLAIGAERDLAKRDALMREHEALTRERKDLVAKQAGRNTPEKDSGADPKIPRAM